MQFLKNLAFIIEVAAVFVGLPYVISELCIYRLAWWSSFLTPGVVVIIFSMWCVERYLHNRKIDVNGFGFLGGLLIVGLGNFVLVTNGLVDVGVFLKLVIIVLAIYLHGMVRIKSTFWLQKAGLAVALISVAFFSSPRLLSISVVAALVLFIVSIIYDAVQAKKQAIETGRPITRI